MKKKNLKIVGLFSVLILLFFISLPTLLNKAGLHPEFDSKKYDFTNKRAVIISTSHSTLNKPGDTTGKLTGVFASELTVPYYEFTDSGSIGIVPPLILARSTSIPESVNS